MIQSARVCKTVGLPTSTMRGMTSQLWMDKSPRLSTQVFQSTASTSSVALVATLTIRISEAMGRAS